MGVKDSVKVELRGPLRTSELDRMFAEEVMRHPGGERLYLCYQCGVCVGGCPVGKIAGSFSPRQIIRLTLLGAREEVLSSDSIWLCASCYTCQERCPQRIDIADLMLAIRNVAVGEGYVPKALLDQALSFVESGRLVKVTGSMERQRSMLGLPAIPSTSLEAVKRIVEATAFDKLLERLRR